MRDSTQLKTVAELFYYCADSPSGLRYAVNRYGSGGSLVASQGAVAGKVGGKGYSQVKVDGKMYSSHRIVWLLNHGSIDLSLTIDHIDGDKWNNRIENLRQISLAMNTRNRAKASTNSSGVTGVSFRGNRFVTIWNEDGKQRYKYFSLKSYTTKDEAFEAAKKFRKDAIDRLNASGAGYTERHGNGNT